MSAIRHHQSSLARRAFLALMLTVGFYTLALVMMGLLLLVVVADLASSHVHFQLLLIAVIGFFAILVSIIPRGDRFEAPWPLMTAEQHPDLFAKLESIAAAAKQRMPDEVYLLPDFNAWVSDRGRGGRRRVMGIGLPLIYLLDVPQFTAVIAHEFGHYYGGDTRLGPWTYRTHATIARTLQNLNENSIRLVQAPFNAYGRMFLRVSRAVSREQEYTADRFAASIAGPGALAGALKRLAGYSPAVNMYWNQLLLPALAAGYRPSVIGGLTLMHSSKHISDAADKVATSVIEDPAEDPFDTHPSLRDRLQALEGLPPGGSADTDSAITLLGELLPVEDQLLRMYMTDEGIAKLEEIDWNDVGERVFVSSWTNTRDRNRAALESWTTDELGAVLYPGSDVAAQLVDVDGDAPASPDDRLGLLYSVSLACICLALREAGWTFIARPDHGSFFFRGEEHASATYLVDMVAYGRASQEAWSELCVRTGISGMRMSGGMSPAGPGNRWTPVLRTYVPATAAEPGLRYEGGNGADINTPIIIRGTRFEKQVVAAQLSRLRDWYGVRGTDWELVGQTRQVHKGRQIDVYELVLKNGRKRFLYFDVTECQPLPKSSPADS